MYDIVAEMCEKRGMSVGAMCDVAGITPSLMSELKAGRTKTLSLETVKKLSEFFRVSADTFLMGIERKENE